jgi:hypothetical protein
MLAFAARHSFQTEDPSRKISIGFSVPEGVRESPIRSGTGATRERLVARTRFSVTSDHNLTLGGDNHRWRGGRWPHTLPSARHKMMRSGTAEHYTLVRPLNPRDDFIGRFPRPQPLTNSRSRAFSACSFGEFAARANHAESAEFQTSWFVSGWRTRT